MDILKRHVFHEVNILLLFERFADVHLSLRFSNDILLLKCEFQYKKQYFITLICHWKNFMV